MNPAAQEALVLITAIFAYSLFIFKFYRLLATRDLIKLRVSELQSRKERVEQRIGYAMENIVLVPFFVLFWVSVLSALIMLLTHHDASTILLLSTALVGAVRISSYVDENLAQDLAKLVPFGFLAVFITDFNLSLRLPELTTSLLYEALAYVAVVIIIEFALRIIHGVIVYYKKRREEERREEENIIKA